MFKNIKHFSIMLFWLVLCCASGSASSLAQDSTRENIHVFAASSLKNALDAAAESYTVKTGFKIRISYAASSVLAHQIEQFAPADIFISADSDWMDYLETRSQLRSNSRMNFLANTLVLIAPLSSKITILELNPDAFQSILGSRKLITGETNSVPLGKYAREALQNLGIWNAVHQHIAGTENARIALTYIARSEAPLGIVYESDARSEPKVKIIARFPAISHKPIIYPLALTKNASKAADAFAEYLQSPAGTEFFLANGFTHPDRP